MKPGLIPKNPSAAPAFTGRELLRLIIPLMISTTLSLLVGMLDTVMVSSVSEEAVSGVSLVDNVMQLMIFVFTSFASGGAVVIGQHLGNRDQPQARECAEQLIHFTFFVSVFLTALTLALRPVILNHVFGSITPGVARQASVYLTITAFSLPGIAVYEAANVVLRTMRDSKTGMWISMAMNAINAAGNAVCIYGLGMDAAGAAIPTLISRWAAALLGVGLLLNPGRTLYLRKKFPVRLEGTAIRSILRMGVPGGLENGIFQLGKILVMRLVAAFGTAAIAANAIAVILTNFISLPGWGINYAVTTVIAQCVGQGDFEQTRYYHRLMCRLAFVSLTAWGGILCLALPVLLPLFHLSPEAYALASDMIYCHYAGTVLFWVPSFLTPTALRAAGDVDLAMVVAILSMWVFRVGGAYLISLPLGAVGVWAAMVLDWVFRALLFRLRWRSGNWTQKRLTGGENN